MNTQIQRYYSDCDYATLRLPDRSEHWLSVRSGGEGGSLFETMKRKIMDLEGTAISHFVMAGCQHYEKGINAMGDIDWPLTWIQGDACRRGSVYSSQIASISGVDIMPVSLDGELVGYQYEDEDARFCRLSGLKAKDTSASRREQSYSVFERMDEALAAAGMEFTDTVRTWLYLERLLEWYGAFNEVRTDFFDKRGVFDSMVPASTGIGAGNPWGAAVLADLLAVAPKSESCRIEPVRSPLQCPAPDYKSSFSRAVELAFPEYRQLLVSGTASIDENGRTAHAGDPEAQIDLTMRVIRELLASRGMDWSNLTRGIAYFKNTADEILWEDWCAANDMPRFPLAFSHADICRDDLLFELEVDAVALL